MLLALKYYHENKTKKIQKRKFIMTSYENKCKKNQCIKQAKNRAILIQT